MRTLLLGSIPLLIAGCAATPDGSNVAQTDRSDAQAATDAGDERPATRAPAVPVVPPAVQFALSAQGLPEEGKWKCDPVFVDVNADGHLDLAAIARLGDGARVWLGDGRGGWTESSAGLYPGKRSCGGGLAFADVDRDGHLDMAVADHCSGVYVYLGDGQGNWRMVTQALNPTEIVPEDPEVAMNVGTEDLDVGDVNGDGHVDVLAGASDEGGLSIYLGDGTGSNWTRQQSDLPQTGWANRVRLADVNGDGRLDVVSCYSAGPRVWLNQGTTEWVPASEGLPKPVMQGLYHGLDVADMNKDGRLDLIVANWVDGPEVYVQQSDGSWSKMPDVFPEMMGGAVGVAVGHLDGDGRLDIVVSGRVDREPGFTRGAYALLANDSGGWTWAKGSGLPEEGLSGVTGLALGDVDDDGRVDVALGSGLSVESAPGRTEPVVPQRLLMWLAAPQSEASSLAEVPGE
ncbi:MAG: FG-GAP repeat domain-containing protein [Planctomycetota bacterium]|jgi:hypothetical protein